MLKIKINDKILINTGKNKKKISTVKQIIKKNKNILVIIKDINLIKKHIKTKTKNKTTNIELPINYSNISIINKNTHKIDKILFKFFKKKKIRIYKSNNQFV